LAKIKNFKHEKKSVAITKTPGNRKKKLSSCWPWPVDEVCTSPSWDRSRIRQKELSDDRHSGPENAGSQLVSHGASGAQIRKYLRVAEKVLT